MGTAAAESHFRSSESRGSVALPAVIWTRTIHWQATCCSVQFRSVFHSGSNLTADSDNVPKLALNATSWNNVRIPWNVVSYPPVTAQQPETRPLAKDRDRT